MNKITDYTIKLAQIILKKDIKGESEKTFRQSIKFGIVGFSNTIISYVLYACIIYICKNLYLFEGYDYLVASLVSFIVSVYWSFYWNDKIVFVLENGQYRNKWKALIKTYISYSFSGLFLSTLLLYLWIDIIGMSEYLAPIVNLLITVPINFFMNKLWAFKSN